jgi:glutathione synthase/RimK-type ligase-like ATP-grasp enzyme
LKVALVYKENTFAEEWLKYLQENTIDHFQVDPYANDAIKKILKADYFFWHFDHFDYKDVLCAKSIINSLEGKVECFPNLKECFYFNDKLSQKYLLEAHQIKIPQTSVFYDKNEAKNFASETKYPIVAKLRKGAGSSNVWLLKNKKESTDFINKSFGYGFNVFNAKKYLQTRFQTSKQSENRLQSSLKGMRGAMINKRTVELQSKEKGYVLFQEYIPNNGFDIRVVVVNKDKAYSAQRDVKENDWAASGSGIASYPDENLDPVYIKEAFEIADKLDTRCIAIDFVRDKNSNVIYTVEVSVFYAFYSMKPASGYWDRELEWNKNSYDPQHFLIDSLLKRQ